MGAGYCGKFRNFKDQKPGLKNSEIHGMRHAARCENPETCPFSRSMACSNWYFHRTTFNRTDGLVTRAGAGQNNLQKINGKPVDGRWGCSNCNFGGCWTLRKLAGLCFQVQHNSCFFWSFKSEPLLHIRECNQRATILNPPKAAWLCLSLMAVKKNQNAIYVGSESPQSVQSWTQDCLSSLSYT